MRYSLSAMSILTTRTSRSSRSRQIILRLTLKAGVPHDVLSSTSGSASAISRTSSNVTDVRVRTARLPARSTSASHLPGPSPASAQGRQAPTDAGLLQPPDRRFVGLSRDRLAAANVHRIGAHRDAVGGSGEKAHKLDSSSPHGRSLPRQPHL